MKLRALFVAVAVFLALSAGPAATAQGIPCSYQAQRIIGPDCDLFGPAHVGAFSISPNGRYVCGYWFCAGGADRPFVWIAPDVFGEPGTFMPINLPGFFGFVYDLHSGSHTFLPAIDPDGLCWVNAINNSNTVCGFRSIGSKGDPVNPQTAFIWNAKDGFTDLGLIAGLPNQAIDISDDRMIAVSAAYGLAAYIWDGSVTTSIGTVAGADGIIPNAIADRQHVVGGCLFLSPLTWVVPFEYSDGVLVVLPSLSRPYVSCSALAVNNNGLIVGGCRPVSGANWRPCSWLGGVIRDLEPLLRGASGVSLEYAVAVSENGAIVCSASESGHVTAVVLHPILGMSGDTNCDRTVDISDLLTVISLWGPGVSYADLNADRIVDILDVIIVIEGWTFWISRDSHYFHAAAVRPRHR